MAFLVIFISRCDCGIMKDFLAFLKTKSFFLHGGLAALSVVLVLFFLTRWLSGYTNHGEYVEVPDFKGQSLTKLDEFIKDKGVKYQIIDSIYDPKEEAGVVIRQDPAVKSKVKHNRMIYLYVTGVLPPSVVMPKLIDRSERQARLILQSYGLKIGKVRTREADCNGCVLSQMIDGKEAVSGAQVRKGTVVDLVIGEKNTFYTPGAADSTTTDPGTDFDKDEHAQ